MFSERFNALIAAQRHNLRRDNPYLLVTFAYLVSLLFAYLQGIRFDATTIGYFAQLLDMELLKTDLLRSVFFLHSQPPLYNLITGISLKTGSYFSPILLAGLFYLLGYLAILAVCDILLTLRAPKVLAVLIASIIAFLPQFIIYQNWYFYTHPVSALLLITACLFLRSKSEVNRFFMVGVASFTAVIMLRSFYHPMLMIIALIMCVMSMNNRKQVVKVFSIPMLIVFLWCLKNLLVFGFFGTSSWSGQNLHKATKQYVGDAIVLKEYQEGSLSEMTTLWEFSEGSAIIKTMSLEPEDWGIPALDHDYKSNESVNRVNSNHWAYVRVSPALTDDSLHLIKAHPVDYLKGVWRLGVPKYILTPSLDPYFHHEEINALPTLEKIASTIETSKIVLSIVLIGLVLNLVSAVRYSDHRLFYVFSYSLILYTLIVGLFGELGENYRFKCNIMWLVICLAIAGWRYGIQLVRRVYSAGETSLS